MIIDAHSHIVDKDWYPDKWWNDLAKAFVDPVKHLLGMELTAPQIVEQIMPSFYDPTGEKCLAEMDNAGIDMTVICAQDYGLLLGDPKVSIEEQNQIFGEIQKKHPKRFLAFCSVDARRPGADKLVRRCFEEWKMSGLKIHSSTGFYPNSKEVYRLLDIANEFKKPVLFHTGQIVAPLRSKYCNPMFLDDVCLDFPDLWIQAAHMSFGWRYELYHLGSCKTNLTVDFSGWQVLARTNFARFCHALRECLDEFTAKRVLWGTDNPYLRAAVPDKDWIQMIKDLPTKAPEGITFTKEEVDAMLGGSAQKIFGIK
ncbi:MAG: amidohydrolase family protein [Candidatus Jordarchaeum sp.]|uniref:amidohydrolase family protein n=1 Tax=Candidatus Jordarchaeum sp. TaxID=2823881 RepID=UPI00404B9D81